MTASNLLKSPSKLSVAHQSTANLSEEEKMAWLRLIRTENVGPVTFYQLLHRFKNAFDALKRLPKVAQSAGRRKPLLIPSLQETEAIYRTYQKKGIHLLASREPAYPQAFRALHDAPPLLSAKGSLELLASESFSVVGSRNASALGRETAYNWSKILGEAGLTIVSGLAEGIDTQAHKASLPTGTIAVLANCINKPYPLENTRLYEAIADRGLVISEAPLGTEPHASLFPRRNRLISGLSWGTLVVEAAAKSGSLLTAHYALEQGRQVFVVPGHPQDPRSRGGNRLIQDGATLCMEPQDMLDARPTHRVAEETLTYDNTALEDTAVTKAREKILPLISKSPTPIDNIQLLAQTNPALTRAALVELTLAGLIQHTPSGQVFRTA